MWLFQIPWLFRLPRCALYFLVLLAVLGSNAALGLGLYATYVFQQWDVVECEPLSMNVERDWVTYNIDLTDPFTLLRRDRCHETFWMAVAYTSAILWALAAGCLARFVTSGNHAAWERRNNCDGDDNETDQEALIVKAEESELLYGPSSFSVFSAHEETSLEESINA